MWPLMGGPALNDLALWGSEGGNQVESPEFDSLRVASSLSSVFKIFGNVLENKA